MANITANVSLLLETIDSVIAAVDAKSNRDILTAIKVCCKQGSPDYITIYGTNTETYIISKLSTGVSVEVDGNFVVPAHPFHTFLKTVKDEVVIAAKDGSIKILEKGTSNELEMGLLDEEDFPAFPTVPDDAVFVAKLSCEEVFSAMNKVIFAVAEVGHPRWGALNAVCFDIENKKCALIGTDTQRASLLSFDVDTAVTGQFLVPVSSAEILNKVFSGDFDMLSTPPNTLVFRDSNRTVFSRLLGGSFPAVKKMFPKHPNKLELLPSTLTAQLKKIALAADNDAFKVEVDTGVLRFLSKTREQKKTVKTEIKIDYSGINTQFILNCKHFQQYLKSCVQNEPISLEFNRSNQPLMLTQGEYKHLLITQATR